MFIKEERWIQKFEVKGQVKTYYPTSEWAMKKNLETAKKNGYKKIYSRKLYPFSTMNNQHNFELISNICYIRMHDMDMGEIEWNGEEYNKLYNLKDRADYFFCLPLPVAWLEWEDWKEAKEISQNAILHRQNACIENGRADLVTYC